MKFPLLLLFVVLFTACKSAPTETGNAGPFIIKAPDAGAPKDFDWAYYDYGELPPLEIAQARDSVWTRYGVKTSGVGCVVTDALLHDIKLHNDSLFALLQPKYPGLTEDRIMREIADFEKRPKK